MCERQQVADKKANKCKCAIDQIATRN